MACPFNKESLTQLKTFIDICKVQPQVLHFPEIAFFRDYIESLGGKLPPVQPTQKPEETAKMSTEDKAEAAGPKVKVEEQMVDSDPESELEFDMEGCIEPETVPADLDMGDSTKQPTVEDEDAADLKRMEAQSQLNDGNIQQAIELYSEAIQLNPQHAILFTKRGQALLKLQKPRACVRDCTHALELNCDSAPAYKYRGRAHRLMGEWEQAAKDLRQACKIDLDEETDEWLREVTPHALRIEQHKLKADRRAKERSDRDRIERVRKAKEAHAAAAAQAKAKAAADLDLEEDGDEAQAGAGGRGGGGGMPDFASMFGGAGGAGGAAGKPGMGDFFQLFQDPEIMAACMDPEISKAFEDIASNPANFSKYQDNPKVRSFVEKFQAKMPGAGGMFGGAAGADPATGAPPKPNTEADDGLD